MTVNEFAQLLQNEMILPRDPHIVSRFEELMDEHFDPANDAAKENESEAS